MGGVATVAALLVGTALLKFRDRRRALPIVLAAASVAFGGVGGDVRHSGCWTPPITSDPQLAILGVAEPCPD
jgi:hypothetical protein